jgi:hypothetical protein
VILIVGALATASVGLGAAPAQASVPLSIAISGNHFVNGAGATVRLLGVDVPSTEYACDQGWGYSSLPLTPATADAIAAWHADAVRVPLNEDCWLGLNGQPSYGTQAGYQQAIEAWIAALNAAGLYAIVDLHWSAPGAVNADGQRPMPDAHSVAFWSSVAGALGENHAVVFDAFNEPYSPEANGNSGLAVSWDCWLDGGCPVPVANQDDPIDDSDTYTAVGMQAIVNTIRATGADQPILLGGLAYANDLSGWLAHEPVDPAHQLAASFHNYYGEACDTTSCWNSVVAGVAAQVPVVTGEFDEGDDCADPPASPGRSTFDTTFMQWADGTGVSYLAWGWWVLDTTSTRCSALSDPGDNYALISNTAGSAVAPDGSYLRSHLDDLFRDGDLQGTPAPLQVTTSSLPTARVKAAYRATLQASGGNAPYRWRVTSGRLPAGLHLRSSGVISGKPRVAGTFTFSVTVVDHRTRTKPHTQHTGTGALSITVG